MATVGSHYIKTALGGAKAKGVDTRALLRKARISDKQMNDPNARVHVDLVAKLYSSIAVELNDEFMGFTEKPLKVGTFDLMADWVSHSANLEELLQKGIRFYNQITDEVQISLECEGDHVYFTTEFRRPELDFKHFYIEYWHVIWHRFASWYIGKPIKLLGSYINYTPLDKSEYDLLFRCPTYLKSKYNRLVFHRKYLYEPLIKSHRELQVFLHRAPIDLLTIPGEDSSLSARIYQSLEPKIKQGEVIPCSITLAKELNISEQTLRRKLTAEGTSYQQIKDNLRTDMANKLLRDRSITIASISKQLGFSEPRAFTRAYKQWMDVTPREYRVQRLGVIGRK